MPDSTLKNLFDYQRLAQNPALQAVIDEVLDRYARIKVFPLSDDEIALAAAGTGLPPVDESQEPKL